MYYFELRNTSKFENKMGFKYAHIVVLYDKYYYSFGRRNFKFHFFGIFYIVFPYDICVFCNNRKIFVFSSVTPLTMHLRAL